MPTRPLPPPPPSPSTPSVRPPASHRRTQSGKHSSRPSRSRSRINGGRFILALVVGALFAVIVLSALVLLGVIDFPGTNSPDPTPPNPSSSHHSDSSNPHQSSASASATPIPADLAVRAVPTTSDTPDSSSATPLSGLTTLNLFFLADTIPSAQPSTPITTASPGPNDSPAGLAAYNCVPLPDRAVRSLCWGTVLLPDGQLSFQGAQPDRSDTASNPDPASPAHDVALTITGGTDAYATARGTLFVDRIPSTSQQNWIFHFTPTPTS